MHSYKLFFLFLLFGCSVKNTIAQDIEYGVLGGAIFSNQYIETEGLDLLNIDYDTHSRFSWEAGLLAIVPVQDDFSIRPTLLLTNRGYRYKDESNNFEFRVKSKLLYLNLELPITLQHDLSGIEVFGGLGPYTGFGLGGRIDVDGTSGNFSFAEEGNVDWGSEDNDDYRPFDFGLTFTGGVAWDRFQISLVYNLGLKNIAPNANDDTITRNRSFSVRGHYFLPF